MRHPKAEEWEAKLKAIFDRIDARLEEERGHRYALHPVRPPHGTTSSREQDGLFDIGAAFSAGFGSQLGPGYVIEARLATLAPVPEAEMTAVEEQVVAMLRAELPKVFPGKDLTVRRDGHFFKIVGDLGLD